MLFFVVILVILIVIMFVYGVKVSMKDEAAKRKFYRKCLSDLANDPTSVELRQLALTAGRMYYKKVHGRRKQKHPQTEWEVSIQNDIMTATGGK